MNWSQNGIFRLENAKGLENDHDDPNLSQEIHSALSKLVEGLTPADLKDDIKGAWFSDTLVVAFLKFH